ncbi:MAG: hypothetical protein BGO01_19870 [Armatimonadetes bacterium 55-13]|nr:cytochrome C oxidase subunit IV family protein [Armatimonadota bacterium]OJU64371.1 MAG: hypothetical protein BGO01_19870 [Armatimonadetes bacterium 55-13]
MAAHGKDHSIHVFPASMYAKTLIALLCLMGLTIFAATVHFPGGTVTNNVVAMTIAVLKAYLVISYFMHVKFSSNLVKLWMLTGFVWVTLMLFILMDYGTRKYEPAPAFDPGDRGAAISREIDRKGENPPKDTQEFIRSRW